MAEMAVCMVRPCVDYTANMLDPTGFWLHGV